MARRDGLTWMVTERSGRPRLNRPRQRNPSVAVVRGTRAPSRAQCPKRERAVARPGRPAVARTGRPAVAAPSRLSGASSSLARRIS